ncbi:MAG: hypothetical protein ABJF11_04015 [Reichenbachiella sp.]|uniref:hypothetical protein n=1 Tax=Reichenbachiella sp. TaxID=2184521 RepID=UPI003263545A
MKDKLDNFISEHRQSFDDLEPRAETWIKIRNDLDQQKPKGNTTWIWKAAAAVFLCLSVGLAIERTMNLGPAQIASVETGSPSTELREVESYYTQLISVKRDEIESVIEDKGLVDMELLRDIEQLDSMYLNLKDDLEKNQNDERLINAMIQNLQLRVEILNKQLKILERISKYEEDEKISV